MNTKIWKTQKGKKIRIKDMGDDHLINTVLMIERKSLAWRQEEIEAGYNLLESLNGEMAIMSVENDLRALERDDGQGPFEFPIYADMVEEVARRGLDGKAMAERNKRQSHVWPADNAI